MRKQQAQMRRSLLLVVGLLSLAIPVLSLAETVVGGPITTDTIWAASNSPFVVSQSIVVINGASLTVEPGVQIRFTPDMGLLVNDGALIARGSAASNILFTANASSPVAESNRWAYIRYDDAARDALFDSDAIYTNGCILEHAVIEYAGGTTIKGAVNIHSSAPYISHCVFRHNIQGAIFATNAHGLRLHSTVITSNSASHAGAAGFIGGTNIEIKACTVYSNTSSVLSSGSLVLSGSGAHCSGTAITANNGGGLYITGSNAVITNNSSSSNPSGYGISLGAFSSSAIIADNVVHSNSIGILSAGVNLSQSCSGALIRGNSICHNNGVGIFFSGELCSGIQIITNTISWNTFDGIGRAGSGSGSVAANGLFIGNTIENNGGEGIDVSGANMTISGNLAISNNTTGIRAYSNQGIISNNTIEGNTGTGLLPGGADLRILDNLISGNSGTGIDGGGDDLTIKGNTIRSNRGHGIYLVDSPRVRLIDNAIYENSMQGPEGGAGVFFWNCTDAILTNNAIHHNVSTNLHNPIRGGHGGGVYFYRYCDRALLIDNVVSSNTATGNGGGICFQTDCDDVHLTGNRINANAAGVHGGGVFVNASAAPSFLLNTLTENHAVTNGGGIYLGSSHSATITENIISHNEVGADGAGLYLHSSTGTVLLGNTISSNTAAGNGRAIYLTDGSDGAVLSQDRTKPTRIVGHPGMHDVYNNNTFSEFSLPESPGNVDARHVWWGTTNTTEIDAAIHDFFDNAGKGRVFYDPFIDLFDLWLIDHGLGTNAMGDADTDGSSNEDEYYAGTNPTNQYSVFAISNVAPFSATQILIHWHSVSNRTYAVQACTNLLSQGWDDLTNGISGTPPLNTVTTGISGAESMFFRVNVTP